MGELIMPPHANDSLMQQFMKGGDGMLQVSQALGSVRSSEAIASRQADELKVKAMIKSSVGFDAVDNKVVSCLVKCAVQQFHAFMCRQVHHVRNHNSSSSRCAQAITETTETVEAEPQRSWFRWPLFL